MGSMKEGIIKLRKLGKSYNEIKNEIGCSKATISYHCKNENLNDIGLDQSKKLNDKEIYELKIFYKTHTIEESILKFGVSRTTIVKYTENKMFVYETDDERRKANYQKVKSFRNRIKERAVEYKGGKCVVCGYNKCVKALEFHHLDPSKKDFGLGTNTNRSWEKVKNEIEKCVLLCANCHRELHDNIIEL